MVGILEWTQFIAAIIAAMASIVYLIREIPYTIGRVRKERWKPTEETRDYSAEISLSLRLLVLLAALAFLGSLVRWWWDTARTFSILPF